MSTTSTSTQPNQKLGKASDLVTVSLEDDEKVDVAMLWNHIPTIDT